MNPARFSVRHPILVNLFTVLVVGTGGVIASRMSREAYPSVSTGWARVTTVFPGAGPEEVERLVTVPLEDVVVEVEGVKRIASFSSEGFSYIRVELEPSVDDVGAVVAKIAAEVSSFRELPPQAEAPLVREEVVRVPTLTVAVRGDVPNRVLQAAGRHLERRLRRVPGVVEVETAGLAQRQLRVDVNPSRLESAGLSLERVAASVTARATNLAAGITDDGERQRIVRGVLRADTAERMADVVVRPDPDGGAVRIGDVASVSDGYSNDGVTARVDGAPAVILDLHRGVGADALRVNAAVRSFLEDERGALPRGVHVSVFNDGSHAVARTMDVLSWNALGGLLLVLITLGLFMNLRNAVMAALGVPVAIAGGIIVMHLLGITLNVLSLGALILCLGLVVDDAIVIIENIYRHMEDGASRMQAAVEGTREVLWPVASSTATTCAAFLPLLIMPGVLGEFFSIIPKVVVAVLVASLIEAFFVLPSHMADFGGRGRRTVGAPRWHVRLGRAVAERYTRALSVCLRYRKTAVVSSFAIAAALVAATLATKDVVLLTEGDVDGIEVRVRMPADASVSATERAMEEVERRLVALRTDDVEAIYTTRGRSQSDLFAEDADYLGMTTVSLVPIDRRSSNHSGRDLLGRAEHAFDNLVGPEEVQVVERELGPPVGAPVTVRIAGEDQTRLAAIAREVVEELRHVPGVREIENSEVGEKRELRVDVDEGRAALHGMTAAAVGSWLRLAFSQAPVARTLVENERVDVIFGLDANAHTADENPQSRPRSARRDGRRARRRRDRPRGATAQLHTAKRPAPRRPSDGARRRDDHEPGGEPARRPAARRAPSSEPRCVHLARRRVRRDQRVGAFARALFHPRPGDHLQHPRGAVPELAHADRRRVGDPVVAHRRHDGVLRGGRARRAHRARRPRRARRDGRQRRDRPHRLHQPTTRRGSAARRGDRRGRTPSPAADRLDERHHNRRRPSARALGSGRSRALADGERDRVRADGLYGADALRDPLRIPYDRRARRGRERASRTALAAHSRRRRRGRASDELIHRSRSGGEMRSITVWAVCVATAGASATTAAAQEPLADTGGPEAGAPAPPAVPASAVDLFAVLRGDGRGLTSDGVAERAVRTAPSVDRAREAVLQARAGAARAIYGFIPQLSLSASYTRLTPIRNGQILPEEAFGAIEHVTDDAARQLWTVLAEMPLPVVLDQYALQATLAIPVSDYFVTILPRWKAAEGVAEAEALRVRASELDVALDAREAFFQYARARGALAVAQIALDQALVREREVAAHVTVGNAGSAEVMQVRALTAQARGAVARAEGGVDISAGALRTLLHMDGEGPLAIGEDVLRDLPEEEENRRALVGEAIARRPEAEALRRIIAAQSHSVDASEGARLPSLVITGSVDYSSPSGRVFPQREEFRFSGNAGVSLEWSLHDLLYGERNADEARAVIGEARADLRALEDAIRNQVTEAHIGYRTARAALTAARAGVDAAVEGYRVRMAQFRTGNALVSDLVDASVAQARAQLELVNAAIDARLALARLHRAVGEID